MNHPADNPSPRAVNGRSAGRWGHVYAAVDLGTNNCRLLVARPTSSGFKVIDSFSRIVRLGEGVSNCGMLSPEAMARTVDALKVCAEKMERRGVTRQRHVATAACRAAANHKEFLAEVRRETGIDLQVITPEEEARLAVSGCMSLFDDGSEYGFVFDIGGGSTELIWVAARPDRRCDIRAWTSLPCGVVTLAELYGGREVTPDDYRRMVAHVADMLVPFEREHRLCEQVSRHRVQMIGTSGTVTTIAGIHLGLRRYDRSRVDGMWMAREHIEEISRRLMGMSYEERVSEPCVGRDRADLVVAGCAIYEAIANTWPCARLRVADRGLREGLLLDLMLDADRDTRGSAHGAASA
ncbi:MAG: Ppx/GppA family phosphatase [Alphaproteobacteria bacterium]|nr:Ppx/GppA family phosphatase [Alphaproteobacteria bacterium]